MLIIISSLRIESFAIIVLRKLYFNLKFTMQTYKELLTKFIKNVGMSLSQVELVADCNIEDRLQSILYICFASKQVRPQM